MLFMIFMTIVNLMKNSFSKGFCKLSDETKMEILMGLKAFFAVFVMLRYFHSNTLFDSDIEKAHEKSLERVNQVMELFGGKLNLPIEFTYSLLASLAALISFATVRLNIRFAYYLYMVTKNS